MDTTDTLPQPKPGRADALDDALDRLSDYSYVDGPGMAVHGPMGAEALSALGHDDLVASWVEDYRTLHETIPAPPRTSPLDADDRTSWQPALGDPLRLADWNELFTRQLDAGPWPEVLGRWVPELLPGYGGAFTHGLLRTAHAVRALQAADRPSPLVLAELAKGLAYWAGTYAALPGRPALQGTRSLEDAVARLPRPEGTWTPMEAALFSRIDELPDFAGAVEALARPPSIDGALSELTATFVRLLLANPEAFPQGPIHAVTPVAASRALLPYLPTVTTEQVYAQLWQVNAALTAGFLPRTDQRATLGADRDPPTPEELVARAVDHKDPHAVKFTEACIRENALRPDPAYLFAAQHVIDRTPAW